MPDPATLPFVERVRNRLRLFWEESGGGRSIVPVDPFAADAGENRFIPMRLSEAGSRFPSTGAFRSASDVERRLGAAADRIRLIAGAWVPVAAGEVGEFADRLRGWGRVLAPGEKVYWVQPLSNNFVLSGDEAEQLLGLVGGVDFIEPSSAAEGPCLVAGGSVRSRACAIGLCWRAGFLAKPVALTAALSRLDQMSEAVRAGIHLIEVPDASAPSWTAGVRSLVHRLANSPEAVLGVRVADERASLEPIDDAIASAGHGAKLRVQWIDRLERAPVPHAPEPMATGISFDCSLAIDAGTEAPRPYIADSPYVPLAFDARVPAAERTQALTEIPRVSAELIASTRRTLWDRLTVAPEREAAEVLRALVDGPVEAAYRRLRLVLDFERRNAYLQALAADPSLVARWHEFHVYNWPPPAPQQLRFVVYDAGDLTQRGSALRALQDLRADFVLDGARFLAAIEQTGGRGATPPMLRQQQIAAHSYLATGGRAELTADSEQLIAELPPDLGVTLEIGFGYGLTARRVARRATTYIGIDLQLAQAHALAEHGGRGLVADIHALPLASSAFDTVMADNVLEHAASPLDVLREVRRVLKPGGRAYVLIPPDAATNEFQIRTHLWKADEASFAHAADLAGLRVVKLQVLSYAELAVYGCFPASRGKTCLVVVERPATLAERRAS